MAVKVFARAQAFGEGHDLWVAAEGPHAHPLKSKLEWYLNFQLRKTAQHITTPLAPQVRAIVMNQNMPFPLTVQQNQGPLLIPAQNNIPTQLYVEVPLSQSGPDHEPWVKQVHTVWKNLNSPSLRIFLPPNLSPHEFQSHWPEAIGEHLAVVPGS